LLSSPSLLLLHFPLPFFTSTRSLKPEKESSLAITGLGAVGIAALFASVYLGVQTIIAIDVVQAKLDFAKKFGATHTFLATDPDLVAKVKALTPYNGGVDRAVECSGNVRALKSAWEITKNRGHVVSVGTPGPGTPIPFGIFENLLAAKTCAYSTLA
jgi:aryl-alcohol dehydrogenase